MLGISNINDFLDRLGIHDMNYSVASKDTFGDLISVFDPDFDYSVMRNAVNSNRAIRNKVEDSGLYHCEIHDTIYINGDAVKVSILCEKGNEGFGTTVKMMVKHVNRAIDGEIKSFLGYESLKSYMSRMKK